MATLGGSWSVLVWDTGGEPPVFWCLVLTGVVLLLWMTLMSGESDGRSEPAKAPEGPYSNERGAPGKSTRRDRAHPPLAWFRRPHRRIRPSE